MIRLTWILINTYKSFLSAYSFMYNLYIPTKKNINNKLRISIILIMCMIIIYLIWGSNKGLSFHNLIGFKWHYFSAFQYCVFSILIFVYAERKFNNTYHAMDYTIQSIFSCAYIYEFPLGISKNLLTNFINENNIILRLSTIFLIYRLYKYNFKPNKITIIITILYLIFSIIAFKYSIHFYIGRYSKFVRIPTMIYIFSLLSFTHLDDD